ncbi:MAG: hypothetical protein JF597_52645, partial [Streptomyces sp.]|uniref:hypothetical protein n=1 Tax=Streptomyces sp. TaxID=1931 RepID=UPI0025CE8784
MDLVDERECDPHFGQQVADGVGDGGLGLLAWDVTRTSGRGGIRLDWEERQGCHYALTALDAYNVLLYTVV